MAFFDKIGDKAKGLVDSAKITYKVSEEKSKLSELYEHLGLLVWEAHRNDEEPPAELVPVFDRIRAVHASIDSLSTELSSVKTKLNSTDDEADECRCGSCDCPRAENTGDGVRSDEQTAACPGCGKSVKGSALFCPFCGTKLPEAPAPDGADAEQKRCCAACGAELSPSAAFCPQCGTKN